MLDAKGRRERGLDVYKNMGWGDNTVLKDIDDELWSLTTDFLFGEIWARPGLSLRDRALVTLVALISANVDPSRHMRDAYNLGITDDEIKEVILQTTFYLGLPRGIFAMKKLKEVQAEKTKISSKQA